MAKTWVTSDLHFGHDREFIWKSRGYTSCAEMNDIQLEKFNSKVAPEDTVYILGDLTLGDLILAKPYLEKLNGHITVIRGNHDTNSRVEYYESLGWEVYDALRIKHNKISYFLCHYPTITTNLEEERITLATVNLYGHTHQTTNFYNDMPFCYHVGVDSHMGYPVDLNIVEQEIIEKVKECKEYL